MGNLNDLNEPHLTFGRHIIQRVRNLPVTDSGYNCSAFWGPPLMPIVVLVFSTLVFWLIYWFFRLGGLEQLQAARAQRRLVQARASDHIAPLRAVEDPRDAAIILMLLIARV